MKPYLVLAALVAATCASTIASAHVRLDYPKPRYPPPNEWSPPQGEEGQQLKESPCGVAGDSRTTDPSRITVFKPGETITVQFRETIGHPGFFRISFDADGQDDFHFPTSMADVQATPMLPVLVDNIPDGATSPDTQVVTLPNVECENCTLQLIQLMTDKGGPPWTQANVYSQCADIVLRSDGTSGGAGGTSSTGGTTSSGGTGMTSAGSAGVLGSGGMATAGASASGGASAGASGSTAGTPRTSGETGGCSSSAHGTRGSGAGLMAALMLAAGLSSRRRSAR